MIKYKLTNQVLQTHKGFQWEVGVKRNTSGNGDLCGPGWLHYYHCPLLAVFLNPIHAEIPNPRLWECEAEGKHKDDSGLKGGSTELTLIREIELPVVKTEHRVRFAILCAKVVFDAESPWSAWADKWLSGEDRSNASARAAAEAADWASARASAAASAAASARAAAEAADWASVRAADWASVRAAVRAARAADWASVRAADWAAVRAGSINLVEIANQAVQ